MKRRDADAARLEADYIARVRAALADREASEVDEIVQSVREHIEEELSQTPDGEGSAFQMSNVLEQLGAPEAYSESKTVGAKATDRAEPRKGRTSGVAIASLILSCLSFLIGPFGCIPGIICGHIARRQCARDPQLGGKGLAFAGLIVGYTFLALMLLGMVLFYSTLQARPTH
jgi:hypothetical protein